MRAVHLQDAPEWIRQKFCRKIHAALTEAGNNLAEAISRIRGSVAGLEAS